MLVCGNKEFRELLASLIAGDATMTISETDERTLIVRWLDQGLDWLDRARERRLAHRLDDRLLADIGVSRGDLAAHLTEAKERRS